MKMNIKLHVGADINVTVDVEDPRNEREVDAAAEVAFERLLAEKDTLLASIQLDDWDLF